MFLFLFVLLIAYIPNRVIAEEVKPVSGRVLKAGGDLGDYSQWIEIAQFGDYSLILRVKCILPATLYNYREIYDGYKNSLAQQNVSRWFNALDHKSVLWSKSVGNDACANLGWCGSWGRPVLCDEYNSLGEAIGTGISLPRPDLEKSAFLLSYQESKRFVCGECSPEGSDEISEEAYANYKYLEQAVTDGEFSERVIESTWLRTPGTSYNFAMALSTIFEGKCLINCRISTGQCCLRPALWVESEIFD